MKCLQPSIRSQPPQSTMTTSRRSFRWRTQLGLLPKDCHMEQSLQERWTDYHRLLSEHPYPHDDKDTNHNQDAPTTTAKETLTIDMDPLTAMLDEMEARTAREQELDRRYRRERARRKRGGSAAVPVLESEDYHADAAALEIIDKDLHRLHHKSMLENRHDILRQVLYLYQCRHPEPGYRQGMHEIASHLLFSLESDDTDPAVLGSECWAMLEAVLEPMQPAFDVRRTATDQPLEALSRRVLSHVAAADPMLHQRLVALGVPPAIYLTKWMRLLFGREVEHVEELWDYLFEQAAHRSLLTVVEAVSAARLLHHRAAIVSEEDALHWLMNLPVETDVEPLLEMATALLQGLTLRLPPLPAPRAVALPPQQQSSQQPPQSATPSLDLNAALDSLKRFSLSGVKETLAVKSQQIGQRIYQDWQANMPPAPPERCYDDPLRGDLAASAAATARSTRPPRTVEQGGTAAPRHNSWAPQQWGPEMEPSLAVVQNFLMNLQRQTPGSVPPAVWHALAELQVVREDIVQQTSQW